MALNFILLYVSINVLLGVWIVTCSLQLALLNFEKEGKKFITKLETTHLYQKKNNLELDQK